MASTSEETASAEGTDAAGARPIPPNAWRLDVLDALSSRPVEEREYILRTRILIAELNEALAWMTDDAPAHQSAREQLLPDFKQVVDRVWRGVGARA